MNIKDRLRDMQSKKYNHTWSAWVQKQCKEAADHIQILETENGNLHEHIDVNAIDAERYQVIKDAACSEEKIQCAYFNAADAICRNKTITPELFDLSVDAGGIAMKAAK